MKARLDIRPYTSRTPNAPASEMLSEAWGPYTGGFTVTEVRGGEPVQARDYHPGFYGLQQAFFLQHYGLPSNILDITHDLDVALFFAQNELTSDNVFVPAATATAQPLLYAFLLDKHLDRFLNSEALAEHHGLLRPLRQKCGILAGASWTTRNFYARFLAIRIKLKNHVPWGELTQEYLFPPPEEDTFLADLRDFQKQQSLGRVRPFVLGERSAAE